MLRRWLDVQNRWMSLVLVFHCSRIAPQMPTETKVFKRAHLMWLTLMESTREKDTVVECCQNELVSTSLPKIKEDLDFCQKRLIKFLDRKRMVHKKF